MTSNERHLKGINRLNELMLRSIPDEDFNKLERMQMTTMANPLRIYERFERSVSIYSNKLTESVKNGSPAPELPDMPVTECLRPDGTPDDDKLRDLRASYEPMAPLWKGKDAEDLLTLYVNSQALAAGQDKTEDNGEKEYMYSKSVGRTINGLNAYNDLFISSIPPEYYQMLCELQETYLNNPMMYFNDLVRQINEYSDTLCDYETSMDEPPDPPENIADFIDKEHTLNIRLLEETQNMYYTCSLLWQGQESADLLELFTRSQLMDKNDSAPAIEYVRAVPGSSSAGTAEAKPAPKPAPEPEKKPAAKDKPAPGQSQSLYSLAARIKNTEVKLNELIVGQKHAVSEVTKGVFSAMSAPTGKPVSFTFAGPPGVGKTFLGHCLADSVGLPCRVFDMAGYTADQSAAGLVGFDITYQNAAPGTLTTFVRENPECVLIFDEADKASPAVMQLFYPMLDEGRLTDKYWLSKKSSMQACPKDPEPEVSFAKTIIIFTTNAGSRLYDNGKAYRASELAERTVINAIKSDTLPGTEAPRFPEALLSRMGAGNVIMFDRLGSPELMEIADRAVKSCGGRYMSSHGISVSADADAMLAVTTAGSDARSVSAAVSSAAGEALYDALTGAGSRKGEIKHIRITADGKLPLPETDPLTGVLLFAGRDISASQKKLISGSRMFYAADADTALKLCERNDISVVLADAAHSGRKELGRLRERFPETRIWLLKRRRDKLSPYALRNSSRIFAVPADKGCGTLAGELSEALAMLRLCKASDMLKDRRKVISYDVVPGREGNTVIARLTELAVTDAPDAKDKAALLDEAEKPSTRFADVIGAAAAKKELMYFADFLREPRKYTAQGQDMPRGILLYGRPGTGKTMLARAMAGECGVNFIATTASRFVTKYQGSGPEAVRGLFAVARKYAPAVLFIDEIDTIAKPRTGSEMTQAAEDTLNALLTEMDGFGTDPGRPVFILAATNFDADMSGGSGQLDEAFLRRFDRRILIELPDTAERKEFIERELAKLPAHSVSPELTDNLASRSVGMSCAMLANVVNTARRRAFDEGKMTDDAVLEEAFEITRSGEKKALRSESSLLRTARHEAGHAVMNILSGHTPSYMTIEARGDHNGYMQHSGEELEKDIFTRKELLEKVRTALGGRAAEIVFYGGDEGLSTGASGDLRQAAQLLKDMIVKYGMDSEFGIVPMDDKAAGESAEVRKRVNELMLREMDETVRALRENEGTLSALAAELMRRNRLTGDEIRAVAGNAL